jgi:hypothetical protein
MDEQHTIAKGPAAIAAPPGFSPPVGKKQEEQSAMPLFANNKT